MTKKFEINIFSLTVAVALLIAYNRIASSKAEAVE